MLLEKDSDYQSPKPVPLAQKIKRYPAPQKELDLHGFTAPEAKIKTQQFLKNERVKGVLTVIIIVGKGIHSKSGPVLPDVVEDTIQELQHENIVLAYRWEKKRKSKSGSVIVYLT